MSEATVELKAKMAQIIRLREVAELIGWDQQTYMPSGAAASRGEQFAAIAGVLHEMFTNEKMGSLIAQAEKESQDLDPESDEARTIAVTRRDYDLATRVPADLVAEFARQTAIGHAVWIKARKENDFKAFAPELEKMLDLTRRHAEALGYTDHIYDPLLDRFEQGAKQADIARMFADLKPALVALNQAIASDGKPVDDSLLHRSYPVEKQREVTLRIAAQFGFDFTRGRQDEAAHPFCGGAGSDDVRLTTRFDPQFLSQGLYATLHETGHGLYEQGLPAALAGSALGSSVSLGVHESQSRMWENLVGRSRTFCSYFFPELQRAFPDSLGAETAESYYRAVNRVSPSLIRVEADEVTYNLHILLRFELECELLTGALAVKDLPEVWNERMRTYLGVAPQTDSEGVLQDVHWSEGLIGYFPTYSLGNLISGQLWHVINVAIPDLDAQMGRGEFGALLEWLRTNIHSQARRYTPAQLVERATGEPLTSKYYVEYLNAKFRDLYGLA